ncbi:DNA-binding protein [Alistipes dispar]|uniref:DNA-binding protein n=2 Tax=Alistipes TaxID=239759 RepID=UPI003A8C2133
MERTEEILEIVREIRSDISYMKRHRNLLCGVPILEVGEVCDLLKICDRQLRRYHEQGLLTGFYFGRRLLFSATEVTRFVERTAEATRRKRTLKQQLNKL